MSDHSRTEALIVGAGPVGLFAALRLAQRDVDIEVIDAQWRTTTRSYALALHPHSLELLDRAGLAEILIERGHRIDTVAFYDPSERRAELDVGDVGGRYPFVLVLPQQVLEEELERTLRGLGVKICWCHRLRDLEILGDRVLAQVECSRESSDCQAWTPGGSTEGLAAEVEARWVIGADGIKSTVRRSLDIGLDTLGAPSLFGIFEITADFTPNHEMRVMLAGGTTNVLWPLADDRFRWSFELDADPELLLARSKSRRQGEGNGEGYAFLDHDVLHSLTAERAPWFRATIGEIPWSTVVRFDRRLAQRFGQGPVWLAGDAAHLTGPIGVHSMNLGLSEAEFLSETVAGRLASAVPQETLDRFDTRQRELWRDLLGFGEPPRLGRHVDPWVRHHAPRILRAVPATGEERARLAGQLGLAA